MTWYFSGLARFRAEREALEQFSVSHDWFVPIGWRFDDRMRLVLDADIQTRGRVWPVSLRYPEFFPHTPPSVFPRGDETRWSFHQFGRGGELCLEYGPDNWTPDVTGVQMIESTHRLLEGENPAPGVDSGVASRHFESLGRQFRSDVARFLLTRDAAETIAALNVGEAFTGMVVCCHHKESMVFCLRTLTLGNGEMWTSAFVPSQLVTEYFEIPVAVFRLDEAAEFPVASNAESFRAACASYGVITEESFILVAKGDAVNFYWLCKDDSIYHLRMINPEFKVRRLDDSHEALKDKRVGLIGCGSVGSKLASMLARSGVISWLLVDDDLLLPDNLVRHELDWREIGTHKAESLARHLQFVNPAVEADEWKIQLGGQIASASAEAVLKLLGNCDLIIDATANPDVLNILSAVALAKAKPIIWAEVFGGGIGGLMARCRPGLEPAPQYMRRAIDNWFRDQSAPGVGVVHNYAIGEEHEVQIADDADVSVIASHAARFAIDLLARPASIYPYSVYAIGLSAGSIFSEPFDTRPIEVGTPQADSESAQLDKDGARAELQKLVEIMKSSINEAADTGKGC